MRDQTWPQYEKHLGILGSTEVYEIFYDKDTGRIVESRSVQESNGDLRIEAKHNQPKLPFYHEVTVWKRLN